MINTPNFLKNVSRNKIIFWVFVIVGLSLLIITNLLTPKQSTEPTSTIPVIPSITPSDYLASEPLPAENIFNPKQKIIFNWSNPTPQIPETMNGYKITVPLINPGTIAKTSEILGFTVADTIKTLNNTSFMWRNDKSSLFASIDQNQIFYTRSEIPSHTNTITRDDALVNSNLIINRLFGDTFTKNISNDISIRYLILVPGIFDAKETSDPTKANLIELGYRQTIDNFPVVALSTTPKVFTIVLDTQKNVYKIDVFGGFLGTEKTADIELIKYSELQLRAPEKSRRISAVASTSEETAFSKASTLNVTVKSVQLGYFQRSDNSLFPVFLLSGTMSAKNMPDVAAEFFVPAAR